MGNLRNRTLSYLNGEYGNNISNNGLTYHYIIYIYIITYKISSYICIYIYMNI